MQQDCCQLGGMPRAGISCAAIQEITNEPGTSEKPKIGNGLGRADTEKVNPSLLN